jgi:hypothetical protein
MADLRKVQKETDGRSLFIEGYFSKRTWNGEEPDYGYPQNHLPDVDDMTMEIVTGFMAGLSIDNK